MHATYIKLKKESQWVCRVGWSSYECSLFGGFSSKVNIRTECEKCATAYQTQCSLVNALIYVYTCTSVRIALMVVITAITYSGVNENCWSCNFLLCCCSLLSEV